MTFQFKATEQQIRQIAVNAIKSSRPFALGYLNHRPDLSVKPENIELASDGSLHLDYVAGRCVKLSICKIGDDEWQIKDSPTPDYQSWVHKYPTNEALVESVVQSALQ